MMSGKKLQGRVTLALNMEVEYLRSFQNLYLKLLTSAKQYHGLKSCCEYSDFVVHPLFHSVEEKFGVLL